MKALRYVVVFGLFSLVYGTEKTTNVSQVSDTVFSKAFNEIMYLRENPAESALAIDILKHLLVTQQLTPSKPMLDSVLTLLLLNLIFYTPEQMMQLLGLVRLMVNHGAQVDIRQIVEIFNNPAARYPMLLMALSIYLEYSTDNLAQAFYELEKLSRKTPDVERYLNFLRGYVEKKQIVIDYSWGGLGDGNWMQIFAARGDQEGLNKLVPFENLEGFSDMEKIDIVEAAIRSGNVSVARYVVDHLGVVANKEIEAAILKDFPADKSDFIKNIFAKVVPK